MQLPLQITYRGMRHSNVLEAAIRRKAAKLEKLHPGIVSCRVVIEQQGRHHRRGRQFVVRIDLNAGRGEIAVNHHHDEDAAVAVRDAFAAARQALDHRALAQRRRAAARVAG